MAIDIKNKIFGGDVHDDIKHKIKLRQELSNSSKEIFESAGTSAILDEINYWDFDKNGESGTDLSSRTPFARMWTSLNILKDTKSESRIIGQDNIKKWWEDKDKGLKKDKFLKLAYKSIRGKTEEEKLSRLYFNLIFKDKKYEPIYKRI